MLLSVEPAYSGGVAGDTWAHPILTQKAILTPFSLSNFFLFGLPLRQPSILNTEKEKDQFKNHTASMGQAGNRPGLAHLSTTRASWDSCLGSLWPSDCLKITVYTSLSNSVPPGVAISGWISASHSPSLFLLALKSHLISWIALPWWEHVL